jgi:UDPglucose 6-dehydrogenase
MPRPVLSVIGLGKLGSPFAAVMAAKGFNVIGVDKNPAFVRAINNGKAPVQEPLLQTFITRGKKRLEATTDIAEAVRHSDVTFLIVPTPSGPDGTFTNKFILDAIRPIAKEIGTKKTRHVIVVTSTVMPGSSEGIIRETIEKISGKRVGQDVGYCYNPEFIALGNVIQDMLFPDFILIGESDARSGKLVSSIYQQVCGKDVQLQRMNTVNAEITKLSINTYVTTKISFANMLADICERLKGADVDVVSRAVGSDSRIGRKYLKGATAYGGPCFPRDNIALARMARKLGARIDLSKATDAINNFQTERLFRKIKMTLPKGSHIGIAGMAYKPDTPVVERSASVSLAAKLIKEKYKVSILDPLAAKNARLALKGKARIADSIHALAAKTDAVVIAVAEKGYAISPVMLKKRKKPLVIIDCWRMLAGKRLGKKAELVFVGRGPQEEK